MFLMELYILYIMLGGCEKYWLDQRSSTVGFFSQILACSESLLHHFYF